jgi:hypothetical protein
MFDFDALNTDNIMALGFYFEELFIERLNDLYLHLRSINVQPVEIALPWMSTLFISIMPVQEGSQFKKYF